MGVNEMGFPDYEIMGIAGGDQRQVLVQGLIKSVQNTICKGEYILEHSQEIQVFDILEHLWYNTDNV